MADSVGGDITTTGVITVGATVFGEIDENWGGDQDWYRISLTAGTHYYINLGGKESLLDWLHTPTIQVFDTVGTLVASFASNDTFAFLDFVPGATGDYFISAGDPLWDGKFALSVDSDIPETIATSVLLRDQVDTTGYIRADPTFDENWYRVEVGSGYETYAVEVTAADAGKQLGSAYLQLFDATGNIVTTAWNSLLLAQLDSGTYYVSVGGATAASRGYYEIGLASRDDGVSPVSAVDWETSVYPHNEGEIAEISVFFAAGGKQIDDGYGAFVSTGWTAAELAAASLAFSKFEAVTNVKFTMTTSIEDADFVMVQNPNTKNTGIAGALGYWHVGGGTLKYDGIDYELDGMGVFNSEAESWTAPNGLKAGGYGFVTLIHELGHGLGLKHPHNGLPRMRGVKDSDELGDFDLNQGVNTMMSYNDGWQMQPGVSGYTKLGYGWESGPMALDIAQLQMKYGAREHATGDNTYTLPGGNKAGVGFRTIWDTGGTDTIRYGGSKDVTISLQPATLDYSKTGGGVVSYVELVRGGLTIAYGSWIENASGGSGDDWLEGNIRANTLDGGVGRDTADYSSRIRPISVTLAREVAATVKVDGKSEDKIKDIENIVGGTAGDTIKGDSLGNWITGGKGKDVLSGGGGADRFIFKASAGTGNADTISDFKHDKDKLCLDDAYFKSVGPTLTSGEFYAKAGATKAHDASDRIVYNTTTGALYLDADGNKSGGKGALLFATLTNIPTLDHGDFLIV